VADVKRDSRSAPPTHSPRVARTRARILDAAQALFLSRGYSATTIEAIADAAEVSVPTVYVRFESKRLLLKTLLDRTIAGDDEPVPMLERGWMRDALAQDDPAEMIRRIVHEVRHIHERTVALVIAIRAAAGTDADLQGLWEVLRDQRHTVADAIGRSLKRSAPSGLTRRQITDVLYAELSPDVYQMLVIERGWSPRAWEEWITTLLVARLVADRA
jgi:AcrR family transcriptional regulator